MSFLKPDYNYIPMKKFFESDSSEPEKKVIEKIVTDHELIELLRHYIQNIDDPELIKFAQVCSLNVKTSLNVLDTLSFLKKFHDGFIESIKKNFTHITSEEMEELIVSCTTIEKILANYIKSSNVQNKFLIPLMIGILEGMLNYKNY